MINSAILTLSRPLRVISTILIRLFILPISKYNKVKTIAVSARSWVLIHAFITTRLDYYNLLLASLPECCFDLTLQRGFSSQGVQQWIQKCVHIPYKYHKHSVERENWFEKGVGIGPFFNPVKHSETFPSKNKAFIYNHGLELTVAQRGLSYFIRMSYFTGLPSFDLNPGDNLSIHRPIPTSSTLSYILSRWHFL